AALGDASFLPGPGHGITPAADATEIVSSNRPHQLHVHQLAPQVPKPTGPIYDAFSLFMHPVTPTHVRIHFQLPCLGAILAVRSRTPIASPVRTRSGFESKRITASFSGVFSKTKSRTTALGNTSMPSSARSRSAFVVF